MARRRWRLRPAASIRASGRRAAGRRVRRRGFRRRSRRRRRAAALIGRTAGTSAGPESSRAAPSTTSRSNSRRAARPVIGAWRAASAGETQSWASRRSTIFWAGFERSLGATAIRVFGAAGKIGGEVEGGGGGERDRACGGVWPGWVARPWPSAGARRPQGRIQNFRSDQRHGPRPAQPDGDDDVERPERENFGFGRWGVREGGERQGGGLGGRRNRIALPCASLQARCEAVRVHSEIQPRRRVENPAWVEAGRPAGAIAPQRQEVRRGPERVADGEAEVAQRGFVGVEAQDFGGGGGALQREAGAQRPGGGRVGAQIGVEKREPGAGGKQRIALPCPSARPRPGRDRRRRRKGLPFRGFRWARLGSRALRRAAQERAPAGSGGGRRAARDRRESPGHGESLAALCHVVWRGIRPACRGVGDVR